ncbi:hypothetical protein H9P43_007137 [Blastocladiella emersonii ATCC 22665]|nr:hypothetical protein H9P43_007137 [Blastocladiella emersonii ATCC 22665]
MEPLPDLVPTQTSASVLLTDPADHFDPFRDSYAADIFLYHDARIAGRKLGALLCGFHDLRSVALTLADAERKGSRAAMSFVLNDLRPDTIARSLLILHALSTSVLDPATLDRFIGQLWFSEHLEQEVLTFWVDQMRACVDHDWLSSTSPVRVMDEATLKSVRGCLQRWLDQAESLPMSADQAASRKTLLDSRALDHRRVTCVEEAHTCTNSKCKHSRRILGDVLTERVSSAVFFDAEDKVPRAYDARTRCEIERVVEASSFFLSARSDRCPNPTFFGAKSREAKIIAAPSAGFFVDVTQERIEQSMERQLSAWLRALAAAFAPASKGSKGVQHRVTFALGDAVLVMEQLTADPELRFDVVDTSTLADRCGDLNLLLHGSVLLKYSDKSAGDRSLLFLCAAKSETTVSPTLAEMFDRIYDLPASLLPVLFGVTLWEQLPQALDSWAAHVQPFAHNLLDSSATMPYRRNVFCKVDAPDAPIALVAAESEYLWEQVSCFIKTLDRKDEVSSYSQGGTFSTAVFPVKLLAYAFAERRLVWLGAEPYTSLPWPCYDADVIEEELSDMGFMNGYYPERGLYARAHGFAFEYDDCRMDLDPDDMDEVMEFEFNGEVTWIRQARATFTLLPGIHPTSVIRVHRTEGRGSMPYQSISHTYDEARGTVDVVWYIEASDVAPAPAARFSLWARPTLDQFDLFDEDADWVRISNELVHVTRFDDLFFLPDGTDAVLATRVPLTTVRGAIRGIMAAAAAVVRKPAPQLTLVDEVTDDDHAIVKLTFELPRGRGKPTVKAIHGPDLAQYRGAVALVIDGKTHTFQLSYPGFVIDTKLYPSRRVDVVFRKTTHAIEPMLGLDPPVPRFALFPVPARGPPVSAFMGEVASATLPRMFTRDEWPQASRGVFHAVSPVLSQRECALGLKLLVKKVFDFAARKGGACVIKVAGMGDRGDVAVIFVHRPIVIPPQGRALGVTPALDVAYVYVPPLPPKSAPAAQRSAAIRLRNLVGKWDSWYDRFVGYSFPVMKWVSPHSETVAEYLDFCHAATVDRSMPDIGQFPQTAPGTEKVASATVTSFAALKGELKRATLLPMYPTYFDNCMH